MGQTGVTNPIQPKAATNPQPAQVRFPNSTMPPDPAETHFLRGEQARLSGELEQAAEAYLQVLKTQPSHWQALGALGQTFTSLCKYPEAMNAFSLALQAAPSPYDNVDNLFHLGQLYKKIRSFEQALACYHYVLKMQPQHRETLIALSQVYRQLGETEQAIAIYDRLLALEPEDPSLLISKALSLPVLYPSTEALQQWRESVEAQFNALLGMHFQQNRELALHGSPFYLAYQGLNDRMLAEKIAKVFQGLLPPMPPRTARRPGKPRIGIISRFLTPQHTVGRFMQGIIQHLSREQFQITAFSVGNDHAYLPTGSEDPADRFVILPADNIETAARLIVENQPDILFYADIGMNVTTYCLAGMRLAPVQCVTWGHPVTTGLPTMDYFISSHLLEPDPETAQTHYSEKLILLDTLPTYYYRPPLEPQTSDRRPFGLNDTANLYVCPQSLFKFHPDFDPMLAAILRQDPQGELVLLSHYTEAVNQQLRDRWAKIMPDVISRIHFLPRMDRQQFLALLNCATVLLDPVHFGGGNTSYEALALGIPIVTWPGTYMRGRVTAACYHRMGLSQLVAQSAEAYVALALQWGTQPQRRAEASALIAQQQGVLFEDKQLITALETFFSSVLLAHLSKEAF